MTSETSSAAPVLKRWACRRYGGTDGLVLEEIPRPQPKDHEILVRIRAATVSSADVRLRTMKLPGGFGMLGRLIFGIRQLRQPVLGSEFSGIVEETGSAITDFRRGDAVIGFPDTSMGSHADYHLTGKPRMLVPKPPNLTFEEAAALCFGGTTALYFLRRAALKAGERILILGASGAVGSAMVQLARHLGAHVTGVTSTRNTGLVTSLGAAAVIDYTRQDFTTLTEKFDVIADTPGCSSFAHCLPLLHEHGRYLSVAGDSRAMLVRPSGTRRSIAGSATGSADLIRELAALAAAGVFRPVVGAVFPFPQIAEAHALTETGPKRGSVVITMPDDPA